VPLASLLLPSVPSTTATYALQAGQFAARESADRLSASLSGQGVTSTVVLTVDTRGTAWAIVTLGRFGSVDEADSQRTYLANKLGLANALPIIVLPPAAPGP
jgi:cell division protein FtsN